MNTDPLARAARTLLEQFEERWPLDLREEYAVSGAHLLALRVALRARAAVDLWEMARAIPCPECGAAAGKKCINRKNGFECSRSHDDRMSEQCVCLHKMRNHTREGVCTRKDRTGRVPCECRCFTKKAA